MSKIYIIYMGSMVEDSIVARYDSAISWHMMTLLTFPLSLPGGHFED